MPDDVELDFEIHRCSSFSGSYKPENILVNNPCDQNSRWSSDSNHPPQFLVLKLKRPAVVKAIRFGKFDKTHVCNVKRFKIFGGLAEEGMIELLESGLRNDNIPERFPLRNTIEGESFPCLFIQIVPLQSWGPSFNFSIWYVELLGDERSSSVIPCLRSFNLFREKEALRLCMKFLKDENFPEICEALEKASGVELENSLVSCLRTLLVNGDDLDAAERLLAQAADDGVFDEYLKDQPYETRWSSMNAASCSDSPGMRGGHQMILDPATDSIYLLGGWDGFKELSDFWVYRMTSGQWECISEDTESDGGPSPRSCHKMVLDPLTRQLFILGKFVDIKSRRDPLKNDMYAYCLTSHSWNLVADDAANYDGPQLLFDHQMVVDSDGRAIYCFGGRVVSDGKGPEWELSGLYAYHIPTNSWTLLRRPSSSPEASPGYIRSRVGHAMLFNPSSRCLLIFGGQRGKEILTDFFVYHVDTDTLMHEVDLSGTSRPIPMFAFTLRATIDVDASEIYALAGISKDRKVDSVRNSFWVYNLHHRKWKCIYQSEDCKPESGESGPVPSRQQWVQSLERRLGQFRGQEPCPRFAHQLLFDAPRRTHYLFGGNPGKNNSSSSGIRLNDFWMLTLHRSSREELVHRCRWELRKSRFLELTASDAAGALRFLQTQVADVVRPGEEEEFHSLASRLMMPEALPTSTCLHGKNPRRLQIFSQLLQYFPRHMTPPDIDLVDLVRVETLPT